MRSSTTGSSVWNLHRIPSISMASCIRFVCQIHGKETTVICSFYFCAVPKDREKMLAAQARWREKNREKLRESYRLHYARNAETLREKKQKYKEANREKVLASDRKSGKKFRDQLRQDVILIFGGKCIRCGFTDWRALQVDHINGGGTRERKSLRNHQAFCESLLRLDS